MKNFLNVWLVMLATQGVIYAQECVEITRYVAPQAKQGVVATTNFFIAISNDSMVMYDKASGVPVLSKHYPSLIHLNSAYSYDGKIIAAHSNYPAIPMWSSLEFFDAKTLQHIDSHSFGIEFGSCTWLSFYQHHYYVFFAHYANPGKMEPGKDVSWSQLVKFDTSWRKIEAWVLPLELIKKISPYSLSGGVITESGKIICSHHHLPELYLLNFPQSGSELIFSGVIPSPFPGQAFALDPAEKNVLWGIDKNKREVSKTKLLWK